MNDWYWQTWRQRPYLTCDLLSPWKHGFFTRHWSPALPDDINQALAPDAPVYRVKQVHGDRVLSVHQMEPYYNRSKPNEPQRHDNTTTDVSVPAADGIVATTSQQSVWVATADCIPVLIGDRRLGSVAAVHAGWRGTAQRIVPQAIAKLQQQGSQLRDLRVALGPAIAGCVYQVSTEVAARVGATVVPTAPEIAAISVLPPGSPPRKDNVDISNHLIQAVLNQLKQMPRSPLIADPAPNRARLDIRHVNQLQLEGIGFAAEQIAIAPYCTYQYGDRFFSYRREPLRRVQWSGIVSE